MSDDQTERIRRAQNEPLELHIIQQEPLLVEVDNEQSQRTHTVLPDQLYCSCEDNRYRDVYCKHLIFVALHDSWIGEAATDRFVEQVNEIADHAESYSEEIDRLLDQADRINEVLDEVRTRNELLDVVDEEIDNTWEQYELQSREHESETVTETHTSYRDDAQSESERHFRSMVDDLQS